MDKSSDLGERLHKAEVKFYAELGKIAQEDPKRIIEILLDGVKSKTDQIKFALIDRFEDKKLRETELEMETDPLLCLDVYINSIIRQLLWLKYVAPYRAVQIRMMREQHRKTKR